MPFGSKDCNKWHIAPLTSHKQPYLDHTSLLQKDSCRQDFSLPVVHFRRQEWVIRPLIRAWKPQMQCPAWKRTLKNIRTSLCLRLVLMYFHWFILFCIFGTFPRIIRLLSFFILEECSSRNITIPPSAKDSTPFCFQYPYFFSNILFWHLEMKWKKRHRINPS